MSTIKITGYDLNKFFYNELETNETLQSKCKPAHISLFMWIVELQNKLGWDVHTIGLPTHSSMTFSCIGNEKTYRNCIIDLVAWGLIIEISKSKNQHQSRKISVQTPKLKNYLEQKIKGQTEKKKAPAPDEMTKADTEATPEQDGSTDQAPTQAELSYKTIKTKKPLNQENPGKPEKSKPEISKERLDMLWEHFNRKYTIVDKPKFSEIINGVNQDKVLVETDRMELNKLIYKFFYPKKNEITERNTSTDAY